MQHGMLTTVYLQDDEECLQHPHHVCIVRLWVCISCPRYNVTRQNIFVVPGLQVLSHVDAFTVQEVQPHCHTSSIHLHKVNFCSTLVVGAACMRRCPLVLIQAHMACTTVVNELMSCTMQCRPYLGALNLHQG